MTTQVIPWLKAFGCGAEARKITGQVLRYRCGPRIVHALLALSFLMLLSSGVG